MYTQWYYKYRADEQKRRNKINFKKIKKVVDKMMNQC